MSMGAITIACATTTPTITTTTTTSQRHRPTHFSKPTPSFYFPLPSIRFASKRSSMASSIQVNASSTIAEGAANEEMKAGSSGLVGENDLLIVGPGVLGRIVAEKWREGNEVTNRFPYVIFCAPPSRTSDYPGDVRLAALNWNGEGSFLFTSSSAPYDCNDNGPCDEVLHLTLHVVLLVAFV
ncbi:hypothetical protein CFP56_024786 [Quercus suber]|uniref:Uncharacterized protein n=1 Tax=Quercus suber TaxID=58331 RepID=A0AAW0K4K6_QUESU